MKKVLLLIGSCLILFSYSSYSQTKRGYKLMAYDYEDQCGKRKQRIAKKVLRKDPFDIEGIYYVLSCYEEQAADSIPIFWDQLLQKHSKNPLAYVRRIQFPEFETLSYQEQVGYLNKAYELEPSDQRINRMLALRHYEQFIDSNTVEFARLALFHWDQLCQIDGLNKGFFKTPCIQLANYLAQPDLQAKYQAYPDRTPYFPILTWANLPEGWGKNYNTNVFEWDE